MQEVIKSFTQGFTDSLKIGGGALIHNPEAEVSKVTSQPDKNAGKKLAKKETEQVLPAKFVESVHKAQDLLIDLVEQHPAISDFFEKFPPKDMMGVFKLVMTMIKLPKLFNQLPKLASDKKLRKQFEDLGKQYQAVAKKYNDPTALALELSKIKNPRLNKLNPIVGMIIDKMSFDFIATGKLNELKKQAANIAKDHKHEHKAEAKATKEKAPSEKTTCSHGHEGCSHDHHNDEKPAVAGKIGPNEKVLAKKAA